MLWWGSQIQFLFPQSLALGADKQTNKIRHTQWVIGLWRKQSKKWDWREMGCVGGPQWYLRKGNRGRSYSLRHLSPQPMILQPRGSQLGVIPPSKWHLVISSHDQDNHNGVIIHLEPDIQECEVKWALESITMNKGSGGDGIPVELFQILKNDAVKVLHSICQQIWKTQQ